MEVIIISGIATLVLATTQFVGHLVVARNVLSAPGNPCRPNALEAPALEDHPRHPGVDILDEAA